MSNLAFETMKSHIVVRVSMDRHLPILHQSDGHELSAQILAVVRNVYVHCMHSGTSLPSVKGHVKDSSHTIKWVPAVPDHMREVPKQDSLTTQEMYSILLSWIRASRWDIPFSSPNFLSESTKVDSTRDNSDSGSLEGMMVVISANDFEDGKLFAWTPLIDGYSAAEGKSSLAWFQMSCPVRKIANTALHRGAS